MFKATQYWKEGEFKTEFLAFRVEENFCCNETFVKW